MIKQILLSAETGLLYLFPTSLVSLVLRIALAIPFFKSGLTKWDGPLQLSETATLLFTEEFKLHFFGRLYDYPFPSVAAYAAGIGEIVLPILLVLGLGTRLAAFGLLIMTVVIQLTIPDAWANFHLPWAAMALSIILMGPGKLALESIIYSRR